VPLDEDHEYAVWTAEWRGGMATDVTGRGHSLRVDEPAEFGGDDSGPMPTEVLVAALASCFCLAVAWAARKKRIPLDDLRVSVQPHRAVGEPRHGTYDVWVESSTADADLAPAVDLAKRYCWVTNTIANPPVLRYHMGAPLG
jgi:putative redox protein